MDINEHLDTLIDFSHSDRRFRSKLYVLKQMDSDTYDSINSVLYDIFYHYMDKSYHEKFNSDKGSLKNHVSWCAKSILSNLITNLTMKKQGRSRSSDIYDKMDKTVYDDETRYHTDHSLEAFREAFLDFAQKNGKSIEAELYLSSGKKYREISVELGISEVALRKRVNRLLSDFKHSTSQRRVDKLV